jgi:hypothetical protein
MDGGLTWEQDIRLTNDPATAYYPSVTVWGSNVHVAWGDNRDGNYVIYYKRSEDGGADWGADTRLTNASGNSFRPCLAVSGLVIHVVWHDFRDGNWEIYYKHSTDGGVTWGADTRLTNDPADSFSASVSVSGSVVHVTWVDNRDGNYEIYYKRSTDGGTSWGTDTRLTNADGDSRYPCIAVFGQTVHIVWRDTRDGDYEIYYKRSTDGGINWEADTRLTNSLGDSDYPSIAVSGLMVHITWQDNRDGDLEIYYKGSEDEGLTWEGDTRLTNSAGDSENASIALSGPMLHVVWTDLRDGNEEIYYKRDPTGNLPVGIGNDLAGASGKQIRIWPNPASNIIHINFNNYSNLSAGQVGEKSLLFLRNILGEELLSKQIQNGESMIDVSSLQNGFYFMSVKTGKNQVNSTKLIIAK